MGRTVKYGGASNEGNMLNECGRWSTFIIQQYLQEILISSAGILHQRVWLAGENYLSKGKNKNSFKLWKKTVSAI